MGDLDEMLVHKILAGDINSFETLVAQHQKKIFSFIYQMVVSVEDARDLTQEVFLQVYRSLDKFRGDAKFSTWLYRIASNKTLDFLRRNKKTKPFDEDIYLNAIPEEKRHADYNPENIYLQEEKIRRLRRLIAGLPDKYRMTLILFHYENLSYQQIAVTLDIPQKTVATRLYRAKLILKDKLGGEIDGMS